MADALVVINAGSSSIKFSLFAADHATLALDVNGQIEGLNEAAHFVAREKHRNYKYLKSWSEWQDSNLRPLRPARSALPG